MVGLAKQFVGAASVYCAFTLVLGGLYPVLIWSFGNVFFQEQSQGRSELIGQHFVHPGYFWGRPSATSPNPYNASASSGSNLASNSKTLSAAVADRKFRFGNLEMIPADLLYASGSGLDPHISQKAVHDQIDRVLLHRKISRDVLMPLIKISTEGRSLGLFGEPRVNVVRLNRLLDKELGQLPK